MRVIVTRPAAQGAAWVRSLAARGVDAVALPLIGIAPPADPAAVAAAWDTLALQRLVVFVSPTAAEAFHAHRPANRAWPPGTRAASVGPGTTQTLRALGVADVVAPPTDGAQFDSQALWEACLRDEDWTGASVLVVRGDGGREWLSDTLRSRGAQVTHVAAYRRVAPAFDAAATRLLDEARARPDDHAWLFSSSEAIDHLVAACDGPWTGAHAIATHPRIAERARERGFGRVHASRPTLDAVIACIQSLAS